MTLHAYISHIFSVVAYRSTNTKQCKAEKSAGREITVGFKGVDEFVELKKLIQDRKVITTVFKD